MPLPRSWASLVPFGLDAVKPRHFRDMARIAWENRDQLPYAYRVLTEGVCDGCALGTTGVRDATIPGVHLCMVRLDLLRTNTIGALDPGLLEDVSRVAGLSSQALRKLGRLPVPLRRKRGDAGFTPVSWDEALDTSARRLAATDPRQVSFFLTSRGMTNETYYAAAKAARAFGTNNVDNSARLCHAPSTVALKAALGWGASTCSYADWIGSDLVVFFGANTPNNQPVTTKYLVAAKRKGTKVAVVNPLREPGLDRYWVPSDAESALFGTRLTDAFFEVHTGGDLAFLLAVSQRVVARGGVDAGFVAERTKGFAAWTASLDAQPMDALCRLSGSSAAEIERFVDLLLGARTAVFVWSMGLTQHAHGSDTVRALINLALARGLVGRAHSGLMPIRGHSGVQAGGELGCAPGVLPGGGFEPENVARLESLWGFPLPREKGWNAIEALEAADRGELSVPWAAGGNFLETLPEPDTVRRALARVPFRVHQDIVLTSQMLVEPAEEVLLLPATTRYEMPGGGTETSTERRIWFSPEVSGPRIAEARPEWQVLYDVVSRARPDRAEALRTSGTAALREEISKAQPLYAGIEKLERKGDVVQWGGRLLGEQRFATSDGMARFQPVAPPERALPEGAFYVSTRRGKQFNSMVHKDRDPLNGACREDVLMSPADARRLGLEDGDEVELARGEVRYRGRVKLAAIRPGNLQVHWPEGNVLVPRRAADPESGTPDYNAVVKLSRLPGV